MDTLSHGLYGAMAFGRSSKKAFVISFLFGIFPDIFAFGFEILKTILTSFNFTGHIADAANSYMVILYSIGHSLVIASAVLILGLILLRSKAIPVSAWVLHILMDIPTHSAEFFPTPYIWPFPTPYIDGIPWPTPWIFFTNWAIIIVLGVAIWKKKKLNLWIKQKFLNKKQSKRK